MADQQDDEPPAPQSIAQRIAALKLNQGSPVPSDPPPSYNQATHSNSAGNSNGASTGRPRPPPPPRPARTASANVPAHPQAHGNGNGHVGNLPEGGEPDARDAGVERPPLPVRTSTQSSAAAPSLPPRRPSAGPSSGADSRRASNYSTSQSLSLSRKESNGSISSLATTRSGTSNFSNGERYAVKAPAYDPSSLPPLPAKKTEEELREARGRYEGVGALGKGRVGSFGQGLREKKSMPGGLQGKGSGTTPPPPAVPSRPAAREAPSLPQRRDTGGEQPPKLPDRGPPPALPERSAPPTLPKRTSQPETVKSPPPPAAREIAAPPPRKSALTMGMNASTNNTAPPVPGRPGSVPQAQADGGSGGPGAPPPVPKDSRPDLAALQASKPRMNGASSTPSAAGAQPPAQTQNACLHCCDFSAPDNHAARFPRESLPSQDLTWLATQLTSPFPSSTDKARALFTWLHHNIAYDTVAFFNHNVQPTTPQSTLNTGLAVCEGYAGLFAALAMKVGLEAYVVGGNGKGFGYSELQPGQPIPPYSAGHAWNVVRIDNGVWKLIDCCWGAGAVNGANQPYQKRFAPERFTQSNDEFGLDHYPEDPGKQFRSDGRVVGWEEYIRGNKNGCGADFFSGYVAEEGLDKTTFAPREGKISLSKLHGLPSVRFSFQKVCPHFDPAVHGKGPRLLYVLALDGLEGTKRNHVPFETDGCVWWCDVGVQDLGRPGGKAQVYAVTSFDGGEGRGLTIERYRQRKGRCAFAFGGVCRWEVVA